MIDINDNLLKNIQQELLSSLNSVEGQIADLIEFDDIQEVDKILDSLYVVEGALTMLSETMAATVCNNIQKDIQLIADDKGHEVNQDKLLLAFLTILQSIQSSFSASSKINHSLVSKSDDRSTSKGLLDDVSIFPVSDETVEAIAFAIKKEFSVAKNLVEENLSNLKEKTVKEYLADSLVVPFAVFKLLNCRTEIELIERIKTLLSNDLIDENIDEFTDNIILLEDALWQSDNGKKTDGKISQKQHSRNLSIQAAKVIFSKTTSEFFKALREKVAENFDNLSSLDMMDIAKNFHNTAATAKIFQKPTLARLLDNSEQQHLFFYQEKEVINKPDVRNLYLELIITYEIAFEQLQHSDNVDKHAISLLEDTQKQLLEKSHFSPKKVASPDYHYASSNSLLPEDIADNIKGITDKNKSLSDIETLDLSETADSLNNTSRKQSVEKSHDSDYSDIVSSQPIDDSDLKDAKYIYQQLTDSSRLSINKDINSVEKEELDEEFLEIFLEEGQGISDLLKTETLRLQNNYFDEELIATLRRAYHTLKGSGRMVGLNVFGEFAWQHEELLNRVVAGECQLNDIALQQFVKAQKLVEETVNSEPFTENKEELLRAAAQAEAIKELLLGKTSMPELFRTNETVDSSGDTDGNSANNNAVDNKAQSSIDKFDSDEINNTEVTSNDSNTESIAGSTITSTTSAVVAAPSVAKTARNITDDTTDVTTPQTATTVADQQSTVDSITDDKAVNMNTVDAGTSVKSKSTQSIEEKSSTAKTTSKVAPSENKTANNNDTTDDKEADIANITPMSAKTTDKKSSVTEESAGIEFSLDETNESNAVGSKKIDDTTASATKAIKQKSPVTEEPEGIEFSLETNTSNAVESKKIDDTTTSVSTKAIDQESPVTKAPEGIEFSLETNTSNAVESKKIDDAATSVSTKAIDQKSPVAEGSEGIEFSLYETDESNAVERKKIDDAATSVFTKAIDQKSPVAEGQKGIEFSLDETNESNEVDSKKVNDNVVAASLSTKAGDKKPPIIEEPKSIGFRLDETSENDTVDSKKVNNVTTPVSTKTTDKKLPVAEGSEGIEFSLDEASENDTVDSKKVNDVTTPVLTTAKATDKKSSVAAKVAEVKSDVDKSGQDNKAAVSAQLVNKKAATLEDSTDIKFSNKDTSDDNKITDVSNSKTPDNDATELISKKTVDIDSTIAPTASNMTDSTSYVINATDIELETVLQKNDNNVKNAKIFDSKSNISSTTTSATKVSGNKSSSIVEAISDIKSSVETEQGPHVTADIAADRKTSNSSEANTSTTATSKITKVSDEKAISDAKLKSDKTIAGEVIAGTDVNDKVTDANVIHTRITAIPKATQLTDKKQSSTNRITEIKASIDSKIDNNISGVSITEADIDAAITTTPAIEKASIDSKIDNNISGISITESDIDTAITPAVEKVPDQASSATDNTVSVKKKTTVASKVSDDKVIDSGTANNDKNTKPVTVPSDKQSLIDTDTLDVQSIPDKEVEKETSVSKTNETVVSDNLIKDSKTDALVEESTLVDNENAIFKQKISSGIENISGLLDELETAKNSQGTLKNVTKQLDSISKQTEQLDYKSGKEMIQGLQSSLEKMHTLPEDNAPQILQEYIREFTNTSDSKFNLDNSQSIAEEADGHAGKISEKVAHTRLREYSYGGQLSGTLGGPVRINSNVKDILQELNISQEAIEALQTVSEKKQEIQSLPESVGYELLESIKASAISDSKKTKLVGQENIKAYANHIASYVQPIKAYFGDWKNSHFTESYYRNNLSSSINDIGRISEHYQMSNIALLGKSMAGLLSKLAEENLYPTEMTANSIELAVNELERVHKAIVDEEDKQEIDPNIVKDVVSRVVMNPKELGSPLDNFSLNYSDMTTESNEPFSHSEAVIIDDFQNDENILEQTVMDEEASEDTPYGVRTNNPLDLDETILGIFLDEAQDINKANQESVADWADNYDNLDAIQSLQRGMHTLKGGARMAGLTLLGDLSHYVETLLEGAVDGAIKNKAEAQSLLEEANDLLDEMVRLAHNDKVIYESPDYIEKLSAFLKAETGKPLDYTRLEKSEEKAQIQEIEVVKKATQKQGYTLRIKSEVMDQISSLIGEGIINRIRVERSVAEHNYQIEELSRTIGRLREQLRRLDVQTEAQMLFRHNTGMGTAKDNNFDPLELDRFSEIQQLSRQLAESMEDLYSVGRNLRTFVDSSRQALSGQEKVQKELQDTIVSTSVVRFDSIFIRMETIIQQVSKDLDKSVQLEIEGGDIEIERNILEKLIPGFEHAIRNAIAHGIETESERKQKDKDPIGRICLSAHRRGADIWFAITDDGQGVNLDSIRDKAKKLGILDEKQAHNKDYLLRLLFQRGFSTSNKVTQIFGRGVGLDVLKDVVRESRGSLEIDTKKDKGMTIRIRLPFTMSIAGVLPVKIGRYMYAIPITSIEGVLRIPTDIYKQFVDGEFTHYNYGQYTYQLESLVDFLDPAVEKTISSHGVPALLAKVGSKRIAFEVGEIGSRQEIIIKSVNKQFTALPGIVGATILDNGRPVPVMEIPTLGRYFLDNKDSSKIRKQHQEHKKNAASIKQKTRILVVDDSVTIRKVSTKILNKYGIEVETAKDGVDAIGVVGSWLPDLILLDIEMPRMDGFEFATYIRNTKEYADIPIIMITSRTGDKHREQAKAIGVNDYLGKPYVEEVLIETIENVLNKKIGK